MLPYYFTNIFSIMLDKNLNMTTLKCFGNVTCLQGRLEIDREVAVQCRSSSGKPQALSGVINLINDLTMGQRDNRDPAGSALPQHKSERTFA